MNINKMNNKKRFYISLIVGVLAVFSLSFTVREIKNASDKLASINKAKNSLEKDIDTKINNEISSNYALNEKLEKKNTNSQNESKGGKSENVNNQIEKDKKILENDTVKEEKTKESKDYEEMMRINEMDTSALYASDHISKQHIVYTTNTIKQKPKTNLVIPQKTLINHITNINVAPHQSEHAITLNQPAIKFNSIENILRLIHYPKTQNLLEQVLARPQLVSYM